MCIRDSTRDSLYPENRTKKNYSCLSRPLPASFVGQALGLLVRVSSIPVSYTHLRKDHACRDMENRKLSRRTAVRRRGPPRRQSRRRPRRGRRRPCLLYTSGSTIARLKLKGMDGGPHKRWIMSVSYTQRRTRPGVLFSQPETSRSTILLYRILSARRRAGNGKSALRRPGYRSEEHTSELQSQR